MAVTDPYLKNIDLSVHLRDARHAHQLYTEHGHAFSPKVKFLYHIVFQPNDEVGSASTSNTWKFQKEIGVLAKSVELPQYRVSVENKQQYNRKKNVQTRIDYQDISIRFHDDSMGATRSLLEEYYRYYYQDGNSGETASTGAAFHPRDKYDSFGADFPNYGLNNYKTSPFFNFIKIYQLSRKQWFSYTLINPLLTSWGHDSLDQTDGSGMMENVISVAYEAVLYNNGEIGEKGEPAAFASEESRYDNVPSPIAYFDENMASQIYTSNPTPNLLNQNRNTPLGIDPRASNSASRPNPSVWVDPDNLPGALPQTEIPTQQSSAVDSSLAAPTLGRKDLSRVAGLLEQNPVAKESFVARALNSDPNNLSYSDYRQLSPESRGLVAKALTTSMQSGDQKLAGFAQDALDATSTSNIF